MTDDEPGAKLLDLSVPRGEIVPMTWGEVEIGHIVQDKKHCFHTMIGHDDHYISLEAVRTGEIVSMPRPAADRPVNVYVPSEREALNLLHEQLGAVFLRDIEHRERTLARQLLWRLDPVPANATSLRDHLDMIHGNTYVDVYMSRANTAKQDAAAGRAAHDKARVTKANARARVALQELQKIHDELHNDPAEWPMAYAHHHGGST